MYGPDEGYQTIINALSMKVLIGRLELAKKNDRASYASVVKSVSKKELKKVKEVSFYSSLDMESRSRKTQYAVATVHSEMTPRLDGKRQCKGTERLGDFFSGKKTLATSQDKVEMIHDIDPIESDDIDRFEDDDEDEVIPEHHGVSYQRLPWTYVGTASDATLQRLRSLPVDTAVPFKEWIKYLVDLGMYLNKDGR